jgi:hypothetical protein
MSRLTPGDLADLNALADVHCNEPEECTYEPPTWYTCAACAARAILKMFEGELIDEAAGGRAPKAICQACAQWVDVEVFLVSSRHPNMLDTGTYLLTTARGRFVEHRRRPPLEIERCPASGTMPVRGSLSL